MGRLRGFLWLVAGVMVALLAALAAFTTLSKAAAQRPDQDVSGPQVQIVVAARAVAVRAPLTAEDVQLKEVPVAMAPEGAVSAVADATGKITLVDLYPGEIILAPRLVDPNVTSADGRQALVVAGDDVLMAFPADDLMSRTGILKPGDHVDLLFSLDFPANRALVGASAAPGASEAANGGGSGQEKEKATFDLLQNMTIAAIVTGKAEGEQGDSGTPNTILLTVSPQDALVLKHVKDSDGVLDIVLRAPGNERPSDAGAVDFDYVINRYRIPVGAGR